ncbi:MULTISPECIES: hypothetical protein [Burkholderia]|nr:MULTISPECIES: hypothetical protein [Burkholderia]
MSKINQCAAIGYNRAAVAKGNAERAVPTAHVQQASDGEKTVVFNLLVLDPKDEESLRQVCSAGTSVVGVATGDPLLAPVISSAGKYSCGSYVKALMQSDNLLIFAPELIPGIDITEDVLRRAGVPEAAIKQADALLHQAGPDALKVSAATLALPVVLVHNGKVPTCVKIWGHKACR